MSPPSPDPVTPAGSDVQWTPDLLGPSYRRRELPLGTDPDGEGPISATLVRHEDAPADPVAALLVVHGLSDYFFHTHLADFLAGRGIATYGVDLRKCGRSRRDGLTPHFVTDLERYDDELDQSLAVIEGDHPGLPVIVAAHSTGGLVVPLWLDRRRDRGALGPVVGLVLNSPWFQLDVPDRVRPLLDPVIRTLGSARPYYQLPLKTSARYVVSTHIDHDGDFHFDTTLKPPGGVGVRAGWLAAVRRAQKRLQSGVHLPLPVLMLRSTASWMGARGRDGEPDVDTDLILDVRSMERYADRVSDRVTDVPVAGARHDVFLSRADVLEVVFDHLGVWLDQILAPHTKES
ncbi:alpha/beta hydrolase [Dietzia sp. PP-33]|uniref:alpha/beta hydrolase n=1 Tax=Dietzia sp. PP-33 TaxID=2957500 RepID=UPI0029BF776F|nr:alpha/beta hydrolase [Dietzia sp. PP-33]MDX2355609.1 alpha/beta hydrolase [Dietzia sp. PP-33]